MFDFLLNNGLGWLFQIIEVLQGPFGGFIVSILFNFILLNIINHMFGMIKDKDIKIEELTQDIKFLAIKTDLSPEDFAKLAENKFIRLSADTQHIMVEEKEGPKSSDDHQ